MCRKSFANIYRLQRHMLSHQESKELRRFKCQHCAKAFKFKHHLKEHTRIHSGEYMHASVHSGASRTHDSLHLGSGVHGIVYMVHLDGSVHESVRSWAYVRNMQTCIHSNI